MITSICPSNRLFLADPYYGLYQDVSLKERFERRYNWAKFFRSCEGICNKVLLLSVISVE